MSEVKLAPWFCLRGHDKNIVGINGNRQCKACKAEQNKKRKNSGDSHKRFIEPVCLRGHDKRVVGVGPHGRCNKCAADRVREKRRKKAQATGLARWDAVPFTQLRSVREDLGVSQRELAEVAGYNRSFIGDLETGRLKATRLAQQNILKAVVRIKADQREQRERLRVAGVA